MLVLKDRAACGRMHMPIISLCIGLFIFHSVPAQALRNTPWENLANLSVQETLREQEIVDNLQTLALHLQENPNRYPNLDWNNHYRHLFHFLNSSVNSIQNSALAVILSLIQNPKHARIFFDYKPFAPTLLSFLQNPDPDTRYSAIFALWMLSLDPAGSDHLKIASQALPTLLARLTDSDKKTSDTAFLILARYATTDLDWKVALAASFKKWQRWLTDENPEIMSLAADILTKSITDNSTQKYLPEETLAQIVPQTFSLLINSLEHSIQTQILNQFFYHNLVIVGRLALLKEIQELPTLDPKVFNVLVGLLHSTDISIATLAARSIGNICIYNQDRASDLVASHNPIEALASLMSRPDTTIDSFIEGAKTLELILPVQIAVNPDFVGYLSVMTRGSVPKVAAQAINLLAALSRSAEVGGYLRQDHEFLKEIAKYDMGGDDMVCESIFLILSRIILDSAKPTNEIEARLFSNFLRWYGDALNFYEPNTIVQCLKALAVLLKKESGYREILITSGFIETLEEFITQYEKYDAAIDLQVTLVWQEIFPKSTEIRSTASLDLESDSGNGT